MKLSFILVTAVILQVSASSYAQHISLNKQRSNLREVLNDIRQQSGFSMICDVDLLDSAKPVTVNLKNVSIEEALKKSLEGQDVTFIINKTTIIITAKTTKKANAKSAITIKGTVRDERNEPIPGVSVKIKNSQAVTITNQIGAYTIAVPDENAILTFTYVGFSPQEITVQKKTIIDVKLFEEKNNLNDVVVIGYGTQKVSSLSTAVSSIKSTDIENQVTGNSLSALTGQVPGLDVQQNTGAPGDNPVIRIRGTGSLGGAVASNAPLYVVDGLALDDAADFNTINPSDIESIDILKDAAASAIYGARGGNGVILVTTKKGKTGSVKLNFSQYTAFQTVNKKIEMLNTAQNIQFNKETILANWLSQGGDPNIANGSRILNGATNNYNYPTLFDLPLNQIPDTDWQDEIFRTAPMANYQVSAQGGTEKLKYFISGNYFDQKGIVESTDFKRYTGRINLESVISNSIKIGLTFSPTYTSSNRLPTDGHFNAGNGEAGTISSALASMPWLTPRTPNGLYEQVSGTSSLEGLGYSSIRNPLQAIYEPAYRNVNSVNRYLATGYFEFKPLKGLTFRSNFGIDYKNNRTSYYKPSTVSGLAGAGAALTPAHPLPAPNTIRANENWGNTRTLNWDNTLNYIKRLKKGHNINLLAGYSVQQYQTDNSTVSGLNNTFTNDLVPYPNGATQINGTYSASKYALISLFGRANYDYKGKYIFSVAMRNDASSRFPIGKKDGYFPSVSAAWRVSEESFFKNLKSLNGVNEVKIRASYGVTGNYPSAPYPYQANLSLVNYTFNNILTAGYAPSRVENSELTWETNKQIDLGLDLVLLKNRLNINIDYYKRNTTGLLYTLPIPSVAGFTNAFGNKGEIENKGYEFNIATSNIVRPTFNWTSNFNISFNHNKVVHLGLNDADVIRPGDAPLSTILRVGQPMAMFYGYKTAGVFVNQADVAANPAMKFNNNSGPGDYKFVDQNGDGKITPEDRTLLANPRPDFVFGFSNRFKYKNFDLEVRLQGVSGGKVFFLLERFLGQSSRAQNNLVYSAVNRWKSEEEPGNGLIPRANISARGSSVGISEGSMDAWLQDASYLKIQNITLGYNLPKSILNKVRLGSMRVYTTVQNLHTFSKYVGFSPEGNSFGEEATIQSVDYGVYPQARIVTFGLNIGL